LRDEREREKETGRDEDGGYLLNGKGGKREREKEKESRGE